MNYSKIDLEQLCRSCITASLKAGDKILYYYNNFDLTKNIKIKADNSPVTVADMAAHQEIVNHLSTINLQNKQFKLPVLSEESNYIDTKTKMEWNDYWLVDPLDGTKEFLEKNGEFCINIALIHKNRPIVGVIYAPYFNVLYCAMLNHGAYKIEDISQDKNLEIQFDNKIKTNKININQLNVVSSRRHNRSSKYHEFIASLVQKQIKYDTVISGSAIKFGLVADGSADIYPRFGLTGEWDTAAGDCILHEAGGALIDLNGDLLYYNKKESLINPEFIAIGDKDFDWKQLLQ